MLSLVQSYRLSLAKMDEHPLQRTICNVVGYCRCTAVPRLEGCGGWLGNDDIYTVLSTDHTAFAVAWLANWRSPTHPPVASFRFPSVDPARLGPTECESAYTGCYPSYLCSEKCSILVKEALETVKLIIPTKTGVIVVFWVDLMPEFHLLTDM